MLKMQFSQITSLKQLLSSNNKIPQTKVCPFEDDLETEKQQLFSIEKKTLELVTREKKLKKILQILKRKYDTNLNELNFIKEKLQCQSETKNELFIIQKQNKKLIEEKQFLQNKLIEAEGFVKQTKSALLQVLSKREEIILRMSQKQLIISSKQLPIQGNKQIIRLEQEICKIEQRIQQIFEKEQMLDSFKLIQIIKLHQQVSSLRIIVFTLEKEKLKQELWDKNNNFFSSTEERNNVNSLFFKTFGKLSSSRSVDCMGIQIQDSKSENNFQGLDYVEGDDFLDDQKENQKNYFQTNDTFLKIKEAESIILQKKMNFKNKSFTERLDAIKIGHSNLSDDNQQKKSFTNYNNLTIREAVSMQSLQSCQCAKYFIRQSLKKDIIDEICVIIKKNWLEKHSFVYQCLEKIVQLFLCIDQDNIKKAESIIMKMNSQFLYESKQKYQQIEQFLQRNVSFNKKKDISSSQIKKNITKETILQKSLQKLFSQQFSRTRTETSTGNLFLSKNTILIE